MRFIRTIFSLLLLAVCWRGETLGQKVNYLYAGHDSTVLEVEFPSVRLEPVEVQGQRSLLPYMPAGIYRQEAGDPDLPNYALPMLMQPGQTASVRILSMGLDTVPGVLIAPSRGMLIRAVDPSTVVRTFGPSYTNDGLFPTQSVEFAAPYWQDTNYGRSLQLYPLQYNPVKRQLLVAKRMQLAIRGLVDPSELLPEEVRAAASYSNIYPALSKLPKVRGQRMDAQYELMVVLPERYRAAIQPLVLWKRQRGLAVSICNYGKVNGWQMVKSPSTLKQYIQTRYEASSSRLRYVLLVGGREDIPPLTRTGISDLKTGVPNSDSDVAYGQLPGPDGREDHVNEIYVGRFSVRGIPELESMVKKVITYERDLNVSDTWLSNGLSIASNQGQDAGDNDETDREHSRLIRQHMLSGGYQQVDTLFDLPRRSVKPQDVFETINSGVGVITYIGHGDVRYWVTSGFTVGHIEQQLRNTRAWPFIFDVACLNGKMAEGPCFAEVFARASRDGKPTGALAINGSRDNQPWAPPMAAQDAMVDYLTGFSPTDGMLEQGQLSYGMLVARSVQVMLGKYTGRYGAVTADTWNTFGDPSVYLRTQPPIPMRAELARTVRVGDTLLSVQCDTEGALAVLTFVRAGEDTAYLRAVVDGGLAQFRVKAIKESDRLTLTVTAPNRQTVVRSLNVEKPNAFCLSFSGVTLKTAAGEEGIPMKGGDSRELSAELCSSGSALPSGPVSLECVLEPSTLGTVAVELPDVKVAALGQCTGRKKLAKVTLKAGIPEGTQGTLRLKAKVGDVVVGDYSQLFRVVAWRMVIDSLSIAASSNGGSVLVPGEMLSLQVALRNVGGLDVENYQLMVSYPDIPGFTQKEFKRTLLPVRAKSRFRLDVQLPEQAKNRNFTVLRATVLVAGKELAFTELPIPLKDRYIAQALFTGYPLANGDAKYQKTRIIIPRETFRAGQYTGVRIPVYAYGLQQQCVWNATATLEPTQAITMSDLPKSVLDTTSWPSATLPVTYDSASHSLVLPTNVVKMSGDKNLLLTIYYRGGQQQGYGVKPAQKGYGMVDVAQTQGGEDTKVYNPVLPPRVELIEARRANVTLAYHTVGGGRPESLRVRFNGELLAVNQQVTAIASVLEGDYTLRFSTDNYLDSTVTVCVRGTESSHAIPLLAPRAAPVTIWVTNKQGASLDGATAEVGGVTAQPDGNGVFHFSFRPGIYPLAVSAPGFSAMNYDIVVTKSGFNGKYALSADLSPVDEPRTMRLYPNPAGSYLEMQLPEGVERLQVLASTGIEMLEAQVTGSRVRIDVRALPAGGYIVRAVGKGRTPVLARFVKL